MLLVVLPLQGVMQLVAGVQGHRHVHTGGLPAAASPSPLRALLDHLHAAQDPRLKAPGLNWAIGKGAAGEAHEHGGVFHTHSHATADVLDVGDPADDARQAGVTAFLAWLPTALVLPAGESGDHPATADPDWGDRVVAPLLGPPRG